MVQGYAGKILFVDLTTGKITEETPDEQVYRDYLGGYGLGAKVLYDHMKGGVDPLGPEAMLGLVTGTLTGTPAVAGTRYTVVAKSPLTGGWGDANSGGWFGPALKCSGYDAVFFTGIAEKPVYLYVEEGKAEIKDASDLWGKNTYDTENILEERHGKGTHVSCIGPAGELKSLVSCVITHKGAAAGRSGLGAVMGSKKLKAVVAKGEKEIPVADRARMSELRKLQTKDLLDPPAGPMAEMNRLMPKYGTASMTYKNAHSGDTPVMNWAGVGIKEIPDVVGLTGDATIRLKKANDPCWHCPISCQSVLYEGDGDYKYPEGTRRVEYETQGSFGPMCNNTDAESITMCNHLCNSYGIDTISGGSIIAFAIECYENGIITKEDTDGIELTWGNHKAIVAMTEKMCKREGIGAYLADGVKVAAEKIGKGAEKYAVHIGGQELGMHDPKLMPNSFASARYHMDPTPGRHTQEWGPMIYNTHITNSIGLCMFASFAPPGAPDYTLENLKATTGWDLTRDELKVTAERILAIRQLFGLREGVNQLNWGVHPRITGNPPLEEGPLAGVTVDHVEQCNWGLGMLDWDRKSLKPSKGKLMALGLGEYADELWPPMMPPAPPKEEKK